MLNAKVAHLSFLSLFLSLPLSADSSGVIVP